MAAESPFGPAPTTIASGDMTTGCLVLRPGERAMLWYCERERRRES
jgi:hypothetical protein